MPNDGHPIEVSLDENGGLWLGLQPSGNVRDLRTLIKRLAEIFEVRRVHGVFEDGTWNIEKSVGIKIPASAKYGDLIEIARAVKESGADPMMLLLPGHLP